MIDEDYNDDSRKSIANDDLPENQNPQSDRDAEHDRADEELDDMLEQTFPASDTINSPSRNVGRPGHSPSDNRNNEGDSTPREIPLNDSPPEIPVRDPTREIPMENDDEADSYVNSDQRRN